MRHHETNETQDEVSWLNTLDADLEELAVRAGGMDKLAHAMEWEAERSDTPRKEAHALLAKRARELDAERKRKNHGQEERT